MLRKSMRFFFSSAVLACAALAGAFAACDSSESSTTTTTDGGSDGRVDAPGSEGGGTPEGGPEGGPDVVAQGRPAPVACSGATRPASTDAERDAGAAPSPDASYECAADTDCTTDATGRCRDLVEPVWFGGKSLGTRCTYHACTGDSDCDGGVCGCALGFAGQHVCLSRSNCRVDADCASGEVCGLSRPFVLSPIVNGDEQRLGGGVPDEALGYFCTTPNDDCAPGQQKDGGASEGCVYLPGQKKWSWWYQP